MPAKIMVVDDEPDLEILISQKFRKKVREKEIDFVFAQNGVEALSRLQAESEVDIVLTDINMPEMDGLTLLTKLGENYPLLKSVIVSAYGDMANIRTALNRGAFDFVTKPIDFQDLEITIEKAIREARALKQAIKDRDQLLTLQQELDVAKRIQESIVPRTFPAFPDRKDFDIYAEMHTAREVGGDFYDFFLIDPNRLGFVIGDVSGKGIPAALLMAVSRTLIKATALKSMPPDECLLAVNRILHMESVSTMFVTVFYGVLDLRNGEVTYCNGGHNPPFILRNDGKVEAMENIGGLMLGAFSFSTYEAGRTRLQRDESLVLYTDGVTEATDKGDNEFGEARLSESLASKRTLSIAQIISEVVKEVRDFSVGVPQSDDITMLVLRYLK